MKKLFIAAAFVCTAASCKKQDLEKMTVVKDCTGTYLKYEGKDYHVCNLQKLESYADGDLVNANFIQIKECNGSANDEIVCYMLHPNEGWIEVQRIR